MALSDFSVEEREELLKEAEMAYQETKLLFHQAKPQEALDKAQRATEIFLRFEVWEGILKSGNALASCLFYLGRIEEALKKLLDFQDKTIAQVGEQHLEIANNHAIIGGCHDRKGNLDKALYHFQISLKIVLSTLGENHPHTAFAYNNIASIYGQKRYFNKVIFFYEKSTAILFKIDKMHFALVTIYTNLAKVHQNKRDFNKVSKHV